VSGAQFLPGIPVSHVVTRLAKAGGKEIESGKLLSSESSAALAVNCFGWFIERPELLPPLIGLETAGVPELVDVEFCARFPWSGGRHPWLDAVVQTPTTLIGIESKRFEPFRDAKSVHLSDAYNLKVWGRNMKSYERMRDRIRSGKKSLFISMPRSWSSTRSDWLLKVAAAIGRHPSSISSRSLRRGTVMQLCPLTSRGIEMRSPALLKPSPVTK
jgi:hypothetical protein